MTQRTRPIRIIQFLPEPKTTFRADIAALFGRYLPRIGIECELIGAQERHSAVAPGAESVATPPRTSARLKKMVSYWWRCWHVMAATDRAGCDVIQVRDLVTLGLFSLCVARWKRIRFCYWMSFLMSEARIMQARARLDERFSLFPCLVLARGMVEKAILYRLVLPHADHVFVQSDAMARYVMAQGIPADRISAVPMGVDTEQFSVHRLNAAASDERARGAGPVLAYLGTLIAARHIETLIDTLQLLHVRWPKAKLLLIGSSDSVAGNRNLLDYAAQCGLADAVEVTGWLPTGQAWNLLDTADVALSWIPRNLFHDMSSPTKLLEYLAAGIPCVANDIPDQMHVITQSQAGWLCNSDAESMATAVEEILNDPVAAKRRASNGPAYIEQVRSYRVIAEAVATSYRNMVG